MPGVEGEKQQETTRFLKRTFFATLVTIAMVVFVSATYMGGEWALGYGAIALWSLVFFSMTPLILKFMLVEQRKGLGLLLIMAKLSWIFLLGGALLVTGEDGPYWEFPGSAAIAGVSTPLVVLMLRVAGAASERKRKRVE